MEDYLEILLRRKWVLIIPLFLSFIGAGLAYFLIPPVYQSSTLILVEPQKVPSDYVKPTVSLDIQERLSTITQQVMSRTRLESIIREFSLYREHGGQESLEERVERMRKHIEINVKGKDGKTSDAFTISYRYADPETAMNVTNKLASLFIEENLKAREQQAEGTTQFLDAQLQEVKKTLEEQEARLRTFKQQYIGELPSQLDANLRTLDRLQLDFQATSEALRLAEDRKATLERQVMESNPLKGRLDSLRAELTRLEGEYTGKYPEISRLRNEIQDLEKKITEEKNSLESAAYRSSGQDPVSLSLAGQYRDLSLEVKNLQEKKMELTRQIKALQSRVERTPAREQQLASLVRDYENTKNNYQSLLGKKLDAQLSENLEKRQKGEQFRILDPANLPEKPFWPNPLHVLAVGLAAGFGTAGGLVLLLEYLDSSFRKVEDLYQATGLPVLAVIPRIQVPKHR